MQRHCFTLDLKEDAELIEEYKRHHTNIWPEVRASILKAGIAEMEIYLLNNRLFMIMQVEDSFSFAAKSAADLADPKVQEWERLMSRYQSPLPKARPGEKWMLMDRIFSLN